MKKIVKIWTDFSNLGVIRSKSENIYQLKILNQICFIIILAFLIGFLDDFFLENFILATFDIAYILLVGIVPYMNYLGRFHVGRLIFVLLFPTIFGIIIVFYGPESNGSYVFILFIISVFILYRDKSSQFFFILYSMFIWLATFFCFKYIPRLAILPPSALEAIFFPVVVFIITILVINSYKSEVEKKEKALELSLSDLEIRNEKLNIANENLERFAFIASHDLKTPLRTIVSFLNIIEKKIDNKEYDGLKQYVSYAIDGGKQMNKLITEVLEYSKLNLAESVEIEEVDLNKVISNVEIQLNSLLAEKKGEIIVEKFCTINSNELVIGLLLQNLIENGIKYNESDKPTIKINCEKLKDGCYISIQDNGIGIPEEYHDKIFQLFTRLHTKDKYAGSGMGLGICKKIVENFGGNINIQSKENEGCTVLVFLPHRNL